MRYFGIESALSLSLSVLINLFITAVFARGFFGKVGRGRGATAACLCWAAWLVGLPSPLLATNPTSLPHSACAPLSGEQDVPDLGLQSAGEYLGDTYGSTVRNVPPTRAESSLRAERALRCAERTCACLRMACVCSGPHGRVACRAVQVTYIWAAGLLAAGQASTMTGATLVFAVAGFFLRTSACVSSKITRHAAQLLSKGWGGPQ